MKTPFSFEPFGAQRKAAERFKRMDMATLTTLDVASLSQKERTAAKARAEELISLNSNAVTRANVSIADNAVEPGSWPTNIVSKDTTAKYIAEKDNEELRKFVESLGT